MDIGKDGRVALKDFDSGEFVTESDLVSEIESTEETMAAVKRETEFLLRGDPNDPVFMEQFGEKFVRTQQPVLYNVLEKSVPDTSTLGGVLQIMKEDRIAVLKKFVDKIAACRRGLEILRKPFDIADYEVVFVS